MGLCSCAGGRICRFAVLQGCGYTARRGTGTGHMALLFSRTMPIGIGVLVSWFRLYPMPLGYGSLRFVEAEVLWITEDHEMSGEF